MNNLEIETDMKEFYLHILHKQLKADAVPPNHVIEKWAYDLLNLIFPERSVSLKQSLADVEIAFHRLEDELTQILNATKACHQCNNEAVAKHFFEQLPAIYRQMRSDIEAILNGDPAATSEFEIIRPKKDKKGNRRFTKEDIAQIRLIYHLVKEKGYTLQGAQEIIKRDRHQLTDKAQMVSRLKEIKTFLIEIRDQLNVSSSQ